MVFLPSWIFAGSSPDLALSVSFPFSAVLTLHRSWGDVATLGFHWRLSQEFLDWHFSHPLSCHPTDGHFLGSWDKSWCVRVMAPSTAPGSEWMVPRRQGNWSPECGPIAGTPHLPQWAGEFVETFLIFPSLCLPDGQLFERKNDTDGRTYLPYHEHGPPTQDALLIPCPTLL